MGFKIADGFIQIETKDNSKAGVDAATKRVKGIDDKTIGIKADDLTTPIVNKIDSRKVADKTVDINADDKATSVIGTIDRTALDDKTVNLNAKDQITPAISKIESRSVNDKDIVLKADDRASGVIRQIETEIPDDVLIPIKVDDQATASLPAMGGKMKSWAIGLGLGSIIGNALIDGLDKVNVVAHFQNQMGATKDVAQKAGESASRVFGEGFVTDKGMISDAISSLSSDVKNWGSITTGEQDKISSGAVKIAQTYGKDVNGVIAASSSMVTNKLAPSFQDAYDLITVGQQNVGSRGDDLIETLQEYSGYFQQLGLDGPDALGIISQMMKAGARDTDYAADALKEFGIRAIDGSEAVSDGFTAIGLDAQEMTKKIAAGGPSARESFLQVVKALQGMKDPVDQNIAGVALFGTQWEDTMRRILPNLDLTKIKLEGVKGATDKLQSELTPKDEIGKAWDKLTDGIAEGFVRVAQGVRNLTGDGANWRAEMTRIQNQLDYTGPPLDLFGKVADTVAYSVQEMGIESAFAAGETGKLKDSVQEFNDVVLAAVNKDIAYRQSLQSTTKAQKDYADAIKTKGVKSREAADAGLALENAEVRQAQAAKDLAIAESHGADEAARNADGSRAYAAEVVKMSQAVNGNGTPALRAMIAGLNDTQLSAAGVTRTVDGAGNAVYRLPNNKEIKVSAEDDASWRIKQIADKKYTATIEVIANTLKAFSLVNSFALAFGRAEGGPIEGPGTGTSDSIPIMASNGEYMIKASVAQKNRPLLDALNSGAHGVAKFAAGGPVGGSGGSGSMMPAGDTYVTNVYAPHDLDVVALAARVSRQQELQRKNRR